jgi:hypothetical protein
MNPKEKAVRELIDAQGGYKVKKVGEPAARQTIGMMRSIANQVPISPFHLAAAAQMESLLEEVLKHRSKT